MSWMAAIFAAVLAVVSQSACPAMNLPYGLSTQTLGNRTFELYVPKRYSAAAPVPFILYAHGWLVMTCKELPPDFVNQSETRGFIFASMCGAIDDTSFNAGICCDPASQNKIDDVGFAKNIVATLSTQLCIDASRVFMTGMSDGAMLSQRVACEQQDNLFAAIASVAGVVELQPGGLTGIAECNATYATGKKRINVLEIHGYLDPIVPWNGDADYPSIPVNMQNWAARSLCPSPPVVTFNSSNFYNQVWENCGTYRNSTVELLVSEFEGHTWPAWWPSIAKVDGTHYVLDFFDRVSKGA